MGETTGEMTGEMTGTKQTSSLPLHSPAAGAHGPAVPAMPRTIVLIGLMGAGKTSIGRRLATRLGLPFRDADHEIEAAAGCTIQEFFERYGEDEFRAGERRVIARLLTEEPVHVLATGGGAYMDPRIREMIRRHAISVWLRAGLDLLVERTGRRNNRPLLQRGDPRRILARLIDVRYPVYARADLTVDSDDSPLDEAADRVLQALKQYFAAR
ncbi:MAG TPA: shikimate kinase [Arenibaculum sp.]|nr:shikimate kinase [Arenibaculum sp.]